MGWNHYASWGDVLRAARKNEYLYYKAPFDSRPHRVRVVRVFKNGKIRLDPETPDADKFTADRGHHLRFEWLG